MKKKILYLITFLLLLIVSAIALHIYAGNPPDQGKSSISGTAAPADGLTSSSVTIVLRDASGNTLSGNDNVDIKSSDSTTTFNPSTVTLDGSGTIYTQMKSSFTGNVPVSVIDNITGTTITGTVAFYQPGSAPPTRDACTDSAPGSVPKITTAVSASAHSITLTWTDAANPVTYYLLSYGTSSGNYIYGNPNIGGQGTTSYTVGGLNTGTKYYFVIRAGNGCTPGNFSNEVSAVPGSSGSTTTPIPTPRVTTTSTTTTSDTFGIDQITDMPTDTPAPEPTAVPTLTPTVSGSSVVGTVVTIGTIVGILIVMGVGVWIYINYRRLRRPPPQYQ